MYLSDLLVAANKEGGEECVRQTINVLFRLPSEWWQVRGCKNWLVVANRSLENDPDLFFDKLNEYADSSAYTDGTSLEDKLSDA